LSDAAPAVVSDAPVSTSTPVPGDASEPVATPSPDAVKDPPPAPAPRKLKAKVYGEEREISADYVEGMAKELGIPPEFVLRNLQTSAAAQKRLQEVAEKEKTWAEREAKLKADPWGAFEGQDPDAAAIARVQAIMEREAMSPEQRKIAEYEAKLKTVEEERSARVKEQQTVAQQAETQKVIAKLNVDLPAAAEAAGLPKSPAVGRMMIDFMLSQARAGMDVNPEDAAQYAKETVAGWTGEVIKGMSGAQIEQFLGPDAIKTLLNHKVAQVRGGTTPAPVPATSPAAPKKSPAFLSTEEWRRQYG
jgi:hypothetical protein